MARKVEDRSIVGVARACVTRSLTPSLLVPPPLVWMTLLLNSFSLVPLLVGICAKMDDTSFDFIQSCFAAGRDLRRHG